MLTLVNRRLSSARRGLSSLVVAEHTDAGLSAGTLSTVTAAQKVGLDVDVLILGKGVGEIAKKAAGTSGVKRVLVMESEQFAHRNAEDISKTLAAFLSGDKGKGYTHILAPSTNNGKNVIPRTAALLDSSPLSDVIKVVDKETFQRPMYAGNSIATVKMSDAKKFLLVRTTVFDKAVATGGSASVETVQVEAADAKTGLSTFISESQKKSARPELTTARVVVSGGRGMKSGENFAMLETLADKLGGAVGASRAAVDAGFVNNEYQVGQTGKVVAPDLYIAVGISGAIQHLSGMKDSKTIVAINKDKEAPIFQVADFGLVDDLFKVVPELNGKL
jgi:electron transfer flavoprotein alpha subunit